MYQTSMFSQEKPVLPRLSVIYEPAGRAREYAPLSCNIYSGCDHGCIYCYAPAATRRKRESFHSSHERRGFLDKLRKDARKIKAAGYKGRVLLCFTCDPYQSLDSDLCLTRQTIEILHGAGLDITVLTKGGSRALRDLDLFTPRDAFAATLTFGRDGDPWRKWEPGAAPPSDRIKTLRLFHQAGIPTWTSLEPVIEFEEAYSIILQTTRFVNLYKIGKMNYWPGCNDKDWGAFATKAIQLLKSLGYERIHNPDDATGLTRGFYIKNDLAAYL